MSRAARSPLRPGSRRLRCAIYTRKSSEEGFEQAFNSLDAQREACEACIRSQRHEGWSCLPTAFDDGGLSGGRWTGRHCSRCLTDIQAGKIDVVVVYKVDRLTRSLSDFAKIVEISDAKGVVLRFGDAAVQHHDLDGAAYPQRAAVLRPIRARGHRRAHPRQVCRLEAEGHVDGRVAAARL